MAIDNHRSKRRKRDLDRKKETRKGHDRILIICEGQKTEPNYFNEIRTEHRLNTTAIKILPSQKGTAPRQIVDYAYDLFINGDSRIKINARDFEQVYAIFDRDAHLSYHDALKHAETINNKKLLNNLKEPIIFKAIVSVPNFELWYLLHYNLIQHPIERHAVIKELKKHILDYEKGNNDCYKKTKHLLDTAISNAAKLMSKNNPYDGKNPYTAVGELVQILTKLNP